MGRTRNRTSGAGANDNIDREQLGPFWLWHRTDRDDWNICWYVDGADGRGRRTSRKSTGIGGGDADRPPQAAIDALAEHYTAWRKPAPVAVTAAGVEGLIADWLLHVEKVDEDPDRAKYAARPWLTFFEIERRAGRITAGPYVSDINRALVQRYIDWRKPQPGARHGSTVSGATISRELAALRATLRHAWENEVIPSAPFIPDLSDKEKAPPKELVFEPEHVARILEAAIRLPERWHVHLFVMIMLSTHGRGEAVLELDADSQIRDGLIYFNAPGRAQTKKRRSIVPIAPTLAPWLDGIKGKVIMYRTTDKEGAVITKPTESVTTAFRACLIEAGLCEQAIGPDSKPAWLDEARTKPKMRAIGSPNTLRHTIATELHKRGIAEAQIDSAAGHSGEGTNKKNYRHLRPGYLKDLIEGVEDYWREVGQHTTAHLRYQRDTNVVDFAARRAAGK
ncbi:tyrosine-type recombinase/integrase [Sphingomonas sp. AR_OL41]|uniref:tyrosine-type recombinase/integrase n=1 Tax=Sphingomonas sp. AR_OL41 TaxID=3042729 RepID=UPI00247FB33C|nr:tyrosine-type recombinase/integrase [Sphingomonas sp. AR_OL41]MDH7973730.1 tyrosine-type recombinase/integrase [Sphingomonas sp. AR_OL41]